MTTTTLAREPRPQPRRITAFGAWVLGLLIMIAVGLISGFVVVTQGLIVTSLSDHVPWGLWITVDLSSIALGAGAFSLATIAYVFRVKAFRQIARMAVFTGLIGYSSAVLALLMDIGRPERFWHPIIYWNPHSVLWQITICVILYSLVLTVEFAPAVLESAVVTKRFPRGPQLGHFLHRFTPVVALFGLGLSLLHQSSYGATYGVLVARPLWYKPSMPALFILSAVGAGALFTLGITVLYENFIQKRKITFELRRYICYFAGLTLLAYLYLKLWDYLATTFYSNLPARIQAIDILNQTTPYGITFWLIEILAGALLPAVILLWPRLRKQDIWILAATALAIAGIVVNRWNVTLSGLIVPLDWSPGTADLFPANTYIPSLVEWGVVIGVVGFGLMLLTLGLRYLPMFPYSNGDSSHPHHADEPSELEGKRS